MFQRTSTDRPACCCAVTNGANGSRQDARSPSHIRVSGDLSCTSTDSSEEKIFTAKCSGQTESQVSYVRLSRDMGTEPIADRSSCGSILAISISMPWYI